MALAGGMDLGESADISSNILSQFRLDPKEMDRVSDVLTGAFTRTNTDLQNIGEAMKYAGTRSFQPWRQRRTDNGHDRVMRTWVLRGSIAGTGYRLHFHALPRQPAGRKMHLKNWAYRSLMQQGKMRPAEVVLTDLYKKISNTAKPISSHSLKKLPVKKRQNHSRLWFMSAGSGELQKLLGELKNAKGEHRKPPK